MGEINYGNLNLLCVKSHQAELSILSAADIDLIIESLCVSSPILCSFVLFLCILLCTYVRFHHK